MPRIRSGWFIVGGMGEDRQRMQTALKFFAKRFVDEPMPLQAIFLSKVFRNDFYPIMGFAARRGARMSGMQVALVGNGQTDRLEQPG